MQCQICTRSYSASLDDCPVCAATVRAIWCGQSNDHSSEEPVARLKFGKSVSEDAVEKFAKLAQRSDDQAIANLGVRLEAQMKDVSGDDEKKAVQGIYASVDQLCAAYCALDGAMRGAASYFFESMGSLVPDMNAPAE